MEMFDGIESQVFVATTAFIGCYLLLRRINQNRVKDAGKRYPPSLPVLKLFGSILRGGMTVIPGNFMRTAEKLGPVFSFTTSGGPTVVVLNGYETIFNAAVRQSEVFAERPPIWIQDNLLNFERRGIINARYNDLFKKYHKLSLSILKEFGFGVGRVTETRILQEVESLNKKILGKNGRQFDPKWPIIFATSNVVLRILFGNEFIQLKDHSTLIVNAIKCISNLDFTLNMTPLVRFLPAFRTKIDAMRTTHQKVLKAIETGIELNKTTHSEATFVERFLEVEGTNYDHKDLLYVLRDLCFASVETVSTTLEWTLVALANHPEVVTRLQREIDDVVPGDRLPSLDDKPRMPYTEAVILEVLRRYTVLPFLIPNAPLRDTKILEYDVAKGCMVIMNAYSAHMNQKFWKDPESFRPERFLDSDNKIIGSEKVITFGLGKRACLGEILGRQQLFLFLTSLVQRFNIRPPEGQNSISVKEFIAVTMTPSPYEVRLIPRLK